MIQFNESINKKTIEIYESNLKSLKTIGKCLQLLNLHQKVNEKHSNATNIVYNPWTTSKGLWTSLEIIKNLWNLLKHIDHIWKWLKIIEHHLTSIVHDWRWYPPYWIQILMKSLTDIKEPWDPISAALMYHSCTNSHCNVWNFS